MNISLKCFAELTQKYDCDHRDAVMLQLPDGATVRDALHIAGIAESDLKIVFVNGKTVGVQHRLRQGDRLALAPATYGM